MAFNPPPYSAHFDGNQVPSAMGVVGTLGTADTGGTANTLPLAVDDATGALYAKIISGTTTTSLALNTGTITTIAAGTQNTLGTVGTVLGIGGTVQVSGASSGTNVNIVTGSSVGTVLGGTLNNLVSGTINALASGTITGGTLGNLVSGTVTAVAVGTIGGKAASGAAAVANPVLIAGTDSGGTIYAPLVSSAGVMSVTGGSNVNIITGSSVGTVLGGTLQNLNSGSVVVTVGTVGGKAASGAAAVANPILIAGTDTGGTIYAPVVDNTGALKVSGAAAGTNVNIVTGSSVGTLLGGTLNNLATGTINALASGTITAGTVVNNGGTVAVVGLGTVTGVTANAGSYTGNPIGMGGTDSGGTIRNILVDSSGVQRSSGSAVITTGTIATGTLQNLVTGTINALAAGTITGGTVQNLVSGTINSGTVVGNGGSIGVQGLAAAAAAVVGNPVGIGGTDSGGTIRFALVNSSGALSVSGASAGTFNNIVTGTQQTLGTVNVVQNAGTIQGGTINNLATGTINALALGTITKPANNSTSGSFTAAGTSSFTFVSDSTLFDIGGTWVGTLFFEGQVGTSNWFAVNTVTPLGIVGTQTIGNGDFIIPSSEFDSVRLRLTYSSGTLNYIYSSSKFFAPLHYMLGGSITNLGAVATGSITVTGGTLTTGTLQNLVSGTINSGTIVGNGGSIGVQGLVAAAAAVVGNPLGIGGTDAGGTIRFANVDSTGALKVAGAAAGTFVNIVTGSLVGTVLGGTLNNLATGTINALASGTITAGTVSVTTGTVVGPVASGGSETGAPVPIGGTDSGGTVRLPLVTSGGILAANIPTGTITTGSLSNVAMLNAGTISTIPNIPGGTIGVVSSLTTGSMVQTAGTLTTGTLQNLVTGTINALATGTITGGTLGNLNYGTVNIDPKPIPVKTTRTTYGTVGTTGAAVFGTLVASVGAGTYAYIAGYQIVVAAGTVDCAILDGTFAQTVPAGGTKMITRGQFVPGGGIARDLTVPYVSGTAGTICYWMGGAGTAYFQVDYWAST